MTSEQIRALQRSAEIDIPVERRAEYIATLEVALQIALWGERAPTTTPLKVGTFTTKPCPKCGCPTWPEAHHDCGGLRA